MKKVLTMSLALLLLALGWTTPSQAKTVYFQPNGNWQMDGARFALYMFGGASDAWTDFAVVDATNHIYKATFDDSQTNMIFCRMNPSTTENNWDNKWNQTGDLAAPANDNQLYILADGQWDNATVVGNGLTVVNSIVMAFGATNATNDTRPFTVETTIAGGVASWGPKALYDGNKVAITQSSVINNATGKFWGGHAPAGTWTNTTALAALNDFTGITFTDADLSSTSKLNVAANGNAGVKTNLELSFDAQDVGDIVTLYTTASGWNCPLDKISVKGLNDCVIEYATYNGNGFSDAEFVSETTDGVKLFKIIGSQLNEALNLFVIKGKLTADKHVTVSSPTTCIIQGSGEQTTKVGFQVAAYKVAKPATLSGTVVDSDGTGIDGATVTLKAANNVEYSGTTAADGTYSIEVPQADLDFTVTVEATNYLTREFAYNLGGESKTLDVMLYQFYGIVGDTGMGLDWNTDAVMTQSTTDPMVFTLELNDVDIVAGNNNYTYEYKLRADGKWGAYEIPAIDNQTAIFPTAGKYNLLFTADVANHTLDLEIVAAEYILTETAFENGGNPFVQTKPIVALTVERAFSAGWNAVCLPFVLTQNEITSTFGAGSEVAFFNGDEENGNGGVKIKFDKFENDLEANKPYLIYVATAVTDPVFANKSLVDPNNAELKADAVSTCYDFMGTYVKIGVPAGDKFIKGGQFVTATTNNKVRAFRSYLKKKDGQSARPVSIFIDGEEMTVAPTGIDSYADDTTIDGNVYNLNGQRMSNISKRGVYIVNGKKVAVK